MSQIPPANSESPEATVVATVPCSMKEFLLYFLHLGTFGFGGPIALAGYMQRELVERRRWISKQDYVDGLALAQLAPGPLAAQLAMYLGWIRAGVLGATLTSVAFIAPSFIMVLALSVLYVRYGGLPWMQGAFYGIGAAVIAIICRSAIKLTKLTLVKDKLLWILFAITAVVTAWTESEIIWVFIGSGVLALLIKAPPIAGKRMAMLSVMPFPDWFVTGLSLQPATPSTLWQVLFYFAEAGAFVFGSGLAIVPFLHEGVVDKFHWLKDSQFLDAVAVAMITPGPVVITVAFIGYLVGGLAGALLAAVGVFLPCYLFVVIPAPYYKKFGSNPQLRAFVSGVTAAATGAIAGAAFVLGRRAIVDVPTVLISVATVGVFFIPKKIPEPIIILAAGFVGLAIRGVSG
jgi:chromate transporter